MQQNLHQAHIGMPGGLGAAGLGRGRGQGFMPFFGDMFERFAGPVLGRRAGGGRRGGGA